MNQMRDLRSISRRYRRYFRTKLRALFSKRELTLEPLDLNEATREVIALSSNDLQRNRIILQSELTDDIPIVTGDRLDSLFEAFYTTKSGGMGIGLFVSRSIVERHEGVRRFQLSSSPLTKMGTIRPKLLARGAVECLFKPFSETALLDALNAALRMR